MELSPQSFLIETLVESVCVSLDPMALANKVDLKLFVDPKIPDSLIGDDNRLRQILTNLLNNAIKFSSKLSRSGEVYFRAELIELEMERAWIRFIVRDNGIGINESAQRRLFQKFEQADTSTTRSYGGSGLGLVICQHLIKLMGGNISLQSVVGEGSEFTVSLPFVVPSEQPAKKLSIIKGLPCLIIGPDNGLTADIHVHLSYAGAVVEHVQDIKSLNRLNTPGDTFWIWVFDLFGTPSLDDMRNVADSYRRDISKNIAIQHLAIGRGRRRKPRLLDADVAQIDGNLLTRNSILHAIAVLAGIENPQQSHNQKLINDYETVAITREQALQQGRLILVAEDNEVNQNVIFEQLKLLNCYADITADGTEALARWSKEDYALVLTDIHMPNMDGYELAREIRSEAAKTKTRYIPIIALTAVALAGEAEKCKAAGMDDYLTKPAPLSELKAILDKWIKPAAPTDGQTALPKAGIVHDNPRPAEGQPDWDANVLPRYIGRNPVQQRKFLQIYLNNLENQQPMVKAAVLSGDAIAIGKIAHKLKSSSRSVGALRVGDLCQELEIAGKMADIAACQSLIIEFDKTCEVVRRLITEYLA